MRSFTIKVSVTETGGEAIEREMIVKFPGAPASADVGEILEAHLASVAYSALKAVLDTNNIWLSSGANPPRP